MTTPAQTPSLTPRETTSPSQSQHPTPALTCEVSPSLTKSQSRVPSQSHGLTTLRSETPRLETETNPGAAARRGEDLKDGAW